MGSYLHSRSRRAQLAMSRTVSITCMRKTSQSSYPSVISKWNWTTIYHCTCDTCKFFESYEIHSVGSRSKPLWIPVWGHQDQIRWMQMHRRHLGNLPPDHMHSYLPCSLSEFLASRSLRWVYMLGRKTSQLRTTLGICDMSRAFMIFNTFFSHNVFADIAFSEEGIEILFWKASCYERVEYN